MENATPDIDAEAPSSSVSEFLKAIDEGKKRDVIETPITDNLRKSETDEKQQFEIAGLKSRQDDLEAGFRRIRDIHLARLIGLCLLFLLVVGWLGIILLFVLLGAMSWPPGSSSATLLKFTDTVILALIGSTTVNVVGLFIIAAKWLYGNHTDEPGPAKSEKPDVSPSL